MATTNLEGDVLLEQTLNDGDITIEGGVVEMAQSFETMVYLCLFGGNYDDDGRAENRRAYWGNITEPNSSRHMISETQYILNTTNPTTEGLLKIEQAALADLAVFTKESIANSVEVNASIPALNRVNISVKINAEGEEQTFNFVENWKAALQ